MSHTFTQLAAADRRLASTVHRLAVSNAPLCERQMPGTGIALHALDQYAPAARAAARHAFGFGTLVEVAAVAAGSPADAADIRGGDGVVAINGRPVGQRGADVASSSTRDTAETYLAAADPSAPITLAMARAGKPMTRTVRPVPACQTRFEVLSDSPIWAQSDGAVIQVSLAFISSASDDDLAVVVAHELAHTVLRHRARLEQAGVRKGVLGGFGRHGRLNRVAEDQADRLSVHLLHNAGFNPHAAVRFWAQTRHSTRITALTGHRSAAARRKLLQTELAGLPTAHQLSTPALLDERHNPIG